MSWLWIVNENVQPNWAAALEARLNQEWTKSWPSCKWNKPNSDRPSTQRWDEADAIHRHPNFKP